MRISYGADSNASFADAARLSLQPVRKRRSVMTKRELIDTCTDKRYVRRDEDGKFKESVDVSRSLSADARHDTKHDTKSGEGDKGDSKR